MAKLIFGSSVSWTKMPINDIQASVKDADSDRYIYLRSRIITVDEPNGNGDYLPKEEILKIRADGKPAWKSFIGTIVDYNHDTNIELGKTIDANYVESKDENDYVEIICKIDRQSPIGATAEYKTFHAGVIARVDLPESDPNALNKMSMEAYAENAECPFCTEIFAFAEPCDHVANFMNATIQAEDGSDFYVYRIDRDITFVGSGIVDNPADKKAEFKNLMSKEEEKKDVTAVEFAKNTSTYEFLKLMDAFDNGEDKVLKLVEELSAKIEEPIFEIELNKFLDANLRLTAIEVNKLKEKLIEKGKMISKLFNAHLVQLEGEPVWLITKNGIPQTKKAVKDIWGKELDSEEAIEGDMTVAEYAVSDIFKRRLLIALQAEGEEYLEKQWKLKSKKGRTIEDVLNINASEMTDKIKASIIESNKDDFNTCIGANKENKDIEIVEGLSKEEAVEAHCFKQVMGIQASVKLSEIFKDKIKVTDEVIGGDAKNFKAWLDYKETGKFPTLPATQIRIKLFAKAVLSIEGEDKEILVKASNLQKYGFNVEDTEKFSILISELDVKKLKKYDFTIDQMRELFTNRFAF